MTNEIRIGDIFESLNRRYIVTDVGFKTIRMLCERSKIFSHSRLHFKIFNIEDITNDNGFEYVGNVDINSIFNVSKKCDKKYIAKEDEILIIKTPPFNHFNCSNGLDVVMNGDARVSIPFKAGDVVVSDYEYEIIHKIKP